MNNLKMLRLDGFLIYVLYVLMKETYLKYTVLKGKQWLYFIKICVHEELL